MKPRRGEALTSRLLKKPSVTLRASGRTAEWMNLGLVVLPELNQRKEARELLLRGSLDERCDARLMDRREREKHVAKLWQRPVFTY